MQPLLDASITHSSHNQQKIFKVYNKFYSSFHYDETVLNLTKSTPRSNYSTTRSHNRLIFKKSIEFLLLHPKKNGNWERRLRGRGAIGRKLYHIWYNNRGSELVVALYIKCLYNHMVYRVISLVTVERRSRPRHRHVFLSKV